MMPNALMDQSVPDPAIQAPGPEQAPAPVGEDTGEPGTDPSAPTLASSGIDPAQVKEAIHKAGVLDAKMSDLIDRSVGGKVNRAAVIKTMVEIVSEGIMTPQGAASFMADLPEDPGDIREWVQKHATDAQTGLAQLIYAIHGSATDAAEATDATGGEESADMGDMAEQGEMPEPDQEGDLPPEEEPQV